MPDLTPEPPMSDGKALLAKATSETLREDARETREMLERIGDTLTPHSVERFTRLAALAEAVAEAEDRSLDLRSYDVSLGDDADVRWRVIEHHMAAPHKRTVSEHNATLPQALSTLLSPPAEVRKP